MVIRGFWGILVRTPEANPRIGNLFCRTSPLHGGAHLLLVVVLGIFFVVLLIHHWMDEDIISPTVSFYVPGT